MIETSKLKIKSTPSAKAGTEVRLANKLHTYRASVSSPADFIGMAIGRSHSQCAGKVWSLDRWLGIRGGRSRRKSLLESGELPPCSFGRETLCRKRRAVVKKKPVSNTESLGTPPTRSMRSKHMVPGQRNTMGIIRQKRRRNPLNQVVEAQGPRRKIQGKCSVRTRETPPRSFSRGTCRWYPRRWREDPEEPEGRKTRKTLRPSLPRKTRT